MANYNYTWIDIALKNILTYKKFMGERDLTCLEKMELQECIKDLNEGGFSNVVEALGF